MGLGSKRKRADVRLASTVHGRKSSSSEISEFTVGDVQQLEKSITESNKHLNDLRTLIDLSKNNANLEVSSAARVAACKIFCRLILQETLILNKAEKKCSIMERWLLEAYDEYTDTLLQFLKIGNGAEQQVIFRLAMRLVKIESSDNRRHISSKKGVFAKLVRFLITIADASIARNVFSKEYLLVYPDVLSCFCRVLANEIQGLSNIILAEDAASNGLRLIQSIDYEQIKTEEEVNYYLESEPLAKTSIDSLKKDVQVAWLSLLKLPLRKEDLKTVLSILPRCIAPWFHRAELLMDFLTDAFNVGGGVSLLALSGLFCLIQERNLDYPAFYTKLYSLLDKNTLHSKYRSQFLRQLEIFMSSTHLPAILIASFLKKLSRLALRAPPAGIVAVIPWVYNMIIKHRTCAFMIHREVRDLVDLKNMEQNGMADPFLEEESDPLQTRALESSLWEIYTLQTHYHPQVAAIAGIISEQFTKASYNLEDFLNHSYDEITGHELEKVLKKAPVVEENVRPNVFVSSYSETTKLGVLAKSIMITSSA